MEEAGTRVASPMFMYNSHGAPRFCDTHPMAKKRSFPFQGTNFTQHLNQQHHQQQQLIQQRLNPGLESSRNSWNPSNWEWDSSRLVAKPLDMMEISRKQQLPSADVSANSDASKKNPVDESEEDERLLLKLGGGAISSEEPVVVRPTKRVCSGSPGGGCGGGSYPMCQVDNCKEDLSAAKDYHRRHKVCEVHSKAAKALVGKQMQRFCQQCSRFHPLSEFDEGKRSCRRRLAGHNKRRRKTQPEDVTSHFLLPGNGDKNSNQDMDIVNLLTALARAQVLGNTEDKTRSSSPLSNKDQLIQILNKIASKSPVSHNSTSIDQDKVSSQIQSKSNGKTGSSTMDLLAVLSGGERSSTTSQSRGEDSDCQILDTPILPLQLFSSSPEDNSPPKLASSRKYFSSDSSSTPMDDGSPSSSPPVVQKLFPTKASRQTMRPESRVLELFGGSNVGAENTSIRSSPYRTGTSSSGSDQSPSSLNYNPQDRTGRILFKLFDKDPSQLPGSLRTQIYNWLSHSPSDMEGYIRPGCVVLSIYVSMSSAAWDKLERNFLQYINSLLQDSRTDFWANGKFLVHTDKHLASHKDGKVHLCKSLRKWSSPQLISICPLAVAAGKETSLFLKGRNLKMTGTKIYCTHANGCTLKEISESSSQESTLEEISTCRFTVCTPSILGRCFIEVENGFRGTSFPIIIADASVCQELKLLESEMAEGGSSSRDEILHFLNELGWLFQRKGEGPCYSLNRFKFLFVFSVERDFCALVKTLLGILLQRDEVSPESLEMLAGINLVTTAVKRRCKSMLDMLVHYAVVDDTSRKYIFPPNLVGPGGITPLHLAACTSNSEDLVDALTNDPQELGLLSWNSCLDANGLSPFMYASMRSNNTYNTLVARKLADRIAAQVCVSISNGLELQKQLSFRVRDSCPRCALVAEKYPIRRSTQASKNLLHRPYIHSVLAIAAVCVCVCLFLRGAPNIGSVAPFKWENLNFGSI